MSTLTLTLTDELDAIEAELAPIRGDTDACPETRRRVIDLIGRATEIRRKLGLLPYTAAGLSPIVAVSLDCDRDWLIARVTHEQEHDDDTVFLANLDDPRIASKVPADLFEEFEELMASHPIGA